MMQKWKRKLRRKVSIFIFFEWKVYYIYWLLYKKIKKI